MGNTSLTNKTFQQSFPLTNPERGRYIWTFLLSSILFFLLSNLVYYDGFRTLDYDSLFFIQNRVQRSFDIPLSFLSLLGSTEITLTIVGVIFLGIYIKTKKLFFSIWIYFLIFIIEFIGKTLIFHPAVPSFFHRYALGVRFPSSSFVYTAYSFPSGHMARTAFLVFVIFFLLLWWVKDMRKRIQFTTFLFFYLLSMFISRISLGEHWLSDVIGGTMLGASLASLAFVLW